MFQRHRRLRTSLFMRDLVRETTLNVNDFIQPIFVKEDIHQKHEIPSMPNVYQFPLEMVLDEVAEIVSLGIKAVIIFGIPKYKDEVGSGAYDDNGIVQQTIRLIKKHYPELIVIADTCLCEFTNHGHCGVIEHQCVLNDESLDLLVKTAISQAKAGADIIAPSNAMDGFVYAIRKGLDDNEFSHVPIMSYSVKFASSFYGPFRQAGESAPAFGDRKTYQMDPANRLEALRESASDEVEGADFLMVKPALSYLDIIRDVKNRFNLPLVAYNVSGEYAMVKAASQNGWIDEEKVVLEMLLSMKRAGADLIITYFAKDAVKYLSK